MTATLECREVSVELIGRYAAGTLEAATARAFEDHFVGCAACQRRLREGVAVRQVLRTELRQAPVRRRASRVPWLVSLGLAAGLGVLWLTRSNEPAAVRLGELREPPALAVMPVRTDGDSVAAWIGRGLEAYRARRFHEAAVWLGRADSVQSSSATRYYRGSALLMAGDPLGAITVLRAETGADDSPFAPEARYLTAKAWLRLNHADSALSVLTRSGGASESLTALAESVRAVLR